MLRLSKKIEYAILAIRYISIHKGNGCTSVKEISESENIPYDLLAKILQKLSKTNLLISQKGPNGGYTLGIEPYTISISDIMEAVEEEIKITDCNKDNGSRIDCNKYDCCSIRAPLKKIQEEVKKVFHQTKLTDLI